VSPFEALQAYRAGGKAIHSQREEEALQVGVKRINGTPCVGYVITTLIRREQGYYILYYMYAGRQANESI
jgi:hypothetical protein